MDQFATAIKSALKPIQALYNKAFDANKYVAGVGLSVLITTGLFFVMVILISLGDSGIKEDTSVKLADVVMPERQIDTFMTEVEKPEQPEEQPEDIAQPDLDLQPLTGIDVSIAKPKANFKAGGSFFRDGEYIPRPLPRRAPPRAVQLSYAFNLGVPHRRAMASEVLRLVAARMGSAHHDGLSGSFAIESATLSGKAIALEPFVPDLSSIRAKKLKGLFVDPKKQFDVRNEYFISELDSATRNMERLLEVEREIEGAIKGEGTSAADRASEIAQLCAVREVLACRRRSFWYSSSEDEALRARTQLQSVEEGELLASIDAAKINATRERFHDPTPAMRLRGQSNAFVLPVPASKKAKGLLLNLKVTFSPCQDDFAETDFDGSDDEFGDEDDEDEGAESSERIDDVDATKIAESMKEETVNQAAHSDKDQLLFLLQRAESRLHIRQIFAGQHILWDLSFDKARELVVEMAGDVHGVIVSPPSWDARDYLTGGEPQEHPPRKRLIRSLSLVLPLMRSTKKAMTLVRLFLKSPPPLPLKGAPKSSKATPRSERAVGASPSTARRNQNANAAALAARNAQKLKAAANKVAKADRAFATQELLLLASMVGPSFKYLTTGMYSGHYQLDLSLERHRRCLLRLEERHRAVAAGAKEDEGDEAEVDEFAPEPSENELLAAVWPPCRNSCLNGRPFIVNQSFFELGVPTEGQA